MTNDSVWKNTVEELRQRLASRAPAPAGVTTAAVSATLALGLLIKVLDITKNRKTFTGDPQTFDALISAAHNESQRLAQLADDDIAAFHEYLAANEEAKTAALRKAIEIPLTAARAAATGLQLCAQSAALIPAPMQPDLHAAEALMKAAIQAMLFSIDANIQQEPDGNLRAKFEAQRKELG